MPLIIEQFICRTDNYGVLVHDPDTGMTAAIDAPEEAPIAERLKQRGWNLDDIYITHHHADHVEGNIALKRAFGATITGPAREADRIPGIDRTVNGGDRLMLGEYAVDVIETPGHTLGHVSYLIPEARIAFVADTLFAVGCGRVIEGTMEMMWESLLRLAALPDDTTVYCGHEYTEANIRFALTVEPNNPDLIRRAAEVKALRAEGRMTLPTTIALEKKTNPFLRAGSAERFAELRRRKDAFK
ncbi:MAG TPA: hydroxyacylglutathione hydrolase [Bauldia sp.]|nr:hydroxyacylglutathione hydrolase [Bauldia sp.]